MARAVLDLIRRFTLATILEVSKVGKKIRLCYGMARDATQSTKGLKSSPGSYLAHFSYISYPKVSQVGVEREVAFPHSHSKPCLILSHHTAPDVDTPWQREQGYQPLLLYFNFWS